MAGWLHPEALLRKIKQKVFNYYMKVMLKCKAYVKVTIVINKKQKHFENETHV